MQPRKIVLIAEPLTREQLVKFGRSLPELPPSDSGSPVLIAEGWFGGGPVNDGWVIEVWGYQRTDVVTLVAWVFEDIKPGERVRRIYPIADLSDAEASALLKYLKTAGKNAKQPLTIKVDGGSMSFFDVSERAGT